jgi:zinc/manganese transport system substrate-binding protein
MRKLPYAFSFGRSRPGRRRPPWRARAAALLLGIAALAGAAAAAHADDVLRVFATTPDLGSLAREVGGDRVSVVEMVKGREDPHFAEARPSFIKELSRADLFVQVGLDLEVGYVPVLLDGARNAAVRPGGAGYVDASRAIAPLDVPAGPVDRSMGDVHAAGSPHYLLDPVRGLEVARLLAAKMSELRPASAGYFEARLSDLRTRLATALAGETTAAKYDAFKLAELASRGGLGAFLDAQGDRASLGGWLGAMLPHAGTKVVDDHAIWTYFASRFGLVVTAHLEPKPGIPPTTGHLREVIERMKADGVRAVIASPYYDPRHARLVADATGAAVIELAHQTGARDGAASWIEMVDYNVRTTAAALSAKR